MAKKLKLRLAELTYVDTMEDLLAGPGRCEQLTGDREGQWSARLTANWRLIVQPEQRDVLTVVIVDITDDH